MEPDLASSSAVPNNFAIAALQDIQLFCRAPIQVSSLSKRDFYLRSQGNFEPTEGPSSTDYITNAPPDDVLIPRRILGSAVPSSTDVPFYPSAPVSFKLRSHIFAGHGVNLMTILLCSDLVTNMSLNVEIHLCYCSRCGLTYSYACVVFFIVEQERHEGRFTRSSLFFNAVQCQDRVSINASGGSFPQLHLSLCRNHVD